MERINILTTDNPYVVIIDWVVYYKSIYIKKFKMLKLLLVIFLSLAVIGETKADSIENKAYAVSDSQINDFLRAFIDSSVANITMLVEFVTKLLRDAMTGSHSALPGNKINKEYLCHH